MAGGKMSARQKMINLMYLVFIAMLALNMSKEVLSAFGFMNEKLVENNISTTEKNALAYDNLATKASEQPAKFGPLKAKADKVREYSSDFYSYLGDLKTKMISEIEDKNDYEVMDKTDWLDAYFFKGDGYTAEGQEFLDKINGYRTSVIQVLGTDSKFVPVLNSRFSTAEVKVSESEKSVPFLKARYEGFPMVASLTNFTQIQADIKNTESDIISDLLGGQLESEVSMSNYNGIVQLDKNAFYPGDKVTGSVVLGRYDPNLKPSRVELNGSKYDNFKDGSVVLDLRAGSVGEKDIKGTIYFMENGEEIPVPFKSTYSVISKPNAPVVSADKMNVVYRGLQNPISISLPGVPDKDIKASAPGLRKTGAGKYMMSPQGGTSVKISVNAKLADGNSINTSSTFRIKDIPAAMGTVRNQFGTVRMPKSGLANTPIGAGLPDFLFDLDLRVTSFKVKVPGQLAIVVNGTVLNAAAKKALAKARRGDMINIFDIKAVIKNNSYKIKKVLPVNIELTN
ncbi:gliding motility protein GldM [Polaribacter haliotis]|uniref:Gliding motility protein GldM n=1 Tax=Polaribacter haliotis TaxID=1888915 RepID=A0A7L8ABA5_9FLAO|nr:gliding motility protein GldM [Polaribacter haliotis]QOD59335.1 gliding motility protein GldM [Polaribacter haliotis]